MRTVSSVPALYRRAVVQMSVLHHCYLFGHAIYRNNDILARWKKSYLLFDHRRISFFFTPFVDACVVAPPLWFTTALYRDLDPLCHCALYCACSHYTAPHCTTSCENFLSIFSSQLLCRCHAFVPPRVCLENRKWSLSSNLRMLWQEKFPGVHKTVLCDVLDCTVPEIWLAWEVEPIVMRKSKTVCHFFVHDANNAQQKSLKNWSVLQ